MDYQETFGRDGQEAMTCDEFYSQARIWREAAQKEIKELVWNGHTGHSRSADEFYDDLREARKQRPAFEAILDEAVRLNWPKRYKSDVVTWDRKAITEHPADAHFIWHLDENGTHMIWLDTPNQLQQQTYLKGVDQRDGHWFYWNGWVLGQVDYSTVVNLAAKVR
jgi:hypothetical protein